jgi:hypothetical protein
LRTAWMLPTPMNRTWHTWGSILREVSRSEAVHADRHNTAPRPIDTTTFTKRTARSHLPACTAGCSRSPSPWPGSPAPTAPAARPPPRT